MAGFWSETLHLSVASLEYYSFWFLILSFILEHLLKGVDCLSLMSTMGLLVWLDNVNGVHCWSPFLFCGPWLSSFCHVLVRVICSESIYLLAKQIWQQTDCKYQFHCILSYSLCYVFHFLHRRMKSRYYHIGYGWWKGWSLFLFFRKNPVCISSRSPPTIRENLWSCYSFSCTICHEWWIF